MSREARETPPLPRASGRWAWPIVRVAAFLAVLPALLSGGGSSLDVTLASRPAPSSSLTLSSPLPQVGAISASSRYIVWTATQVCTGSTAPSPACSPREVYLYDLATNRVRVAARTVFGVTGAIYHYHVADHWLVYLDTGLSHAPSLLVWRLVVVDLDRGRSTVLAQGSGSAASAVPPDLALADGTLVWTSAHETRAHGMESWLSVTALATGRTAVIARTAAPYSFSFPATDGRRAVWERDDFSGPQPASAIIGSDLPPAQPTVRVLSGDALASQPGVWGSLVVWKSGPGFAPGQIMLRGWKTTSAPIPLSSANEPAFSPTIGRGFVAWATGSSGAITIYDVFTRSRTAPSGTRAGWIYGFPTAAGSWLAYSYMTGVPTQNSGLPPRGYIAVRYIGA